MVDDGDLRANLRLRQFGRGRGDDDLLRQRADLEGNIHGGAAMAGIERRRDVPFESCRSDSDLIAVGIDRTEAELAPVVADCF